MPVVLAIASVDELRRYIRETLAAHDRLDPRQAPLGQAEIHRSGRVCGFFFQLEGPRHLRTYAVWATDEQRILFYNSGGVRFAETRLCEPVDVGCRAA
jgi:hypothetical protein